MNLLRSFRTAGLAVLLAGGLASTAPGQCPQTVYWQWVPLGNGCAPLGAGWNNASCTLDLNWGGPSAPPDVTFLAFGPPLASPVSFSGICGALGISPAVIFSTPATGVSFSIPPCAGSCAWDIFVQGLVVYYSPSSMGFLSTLEIWHN